MSAKQQHSSTGQQNRIKTLLLLDTRIIIILLLELVLRNNATASLYNRDASLCACVWYCVTQPTNLYSELFFVGGDPSSGAFNNNTKNNNEMGRRYYVSGSAWRLESKLHSGSNFIQRIPLLLVLLPVPPVSQKQDIRLFSGSESSGGQ